MSITLEQHGISVTFNEPNDLIELMTDEDKLELIESLSCHEAVIKHVADHLIHGSTENGNSGWCVFHWDADHSYETQKAKNAIAKASGDIAQARIEELESHCKYLEDRAKALYNQRIMRS